MNNQQTTRDDIIIGRNAVIEALKSGAEIDCIYIAKGERQGSINVALAKAREKKVTVKEVQPSKLDEMAGSRNHQGIVAVSAFTNYVDVSDILAIAKARNEAPFIIIADEIEDPHNLGAIIRTAEAAGAHGLILPKRRSASVNQTVFKTSAGACQHLAIAKVSNLANTIDSLKKEGIFFYAADMGGTSWDKTDFSGGVGLVIGSEGFGVGKLILDKCDFIVSLPMCGKINSLNASVAAGILMYEITRNRMAR